jgi:two-component system alkaline phosphatase synthesis response regulator PhoP
MSGELVLLVDDEHNITDLAALYLKQEGFRTQAAADGEMALKAVRDQQPALMVLDLMLPVIDGYEVCRRLRAENNPIPILMLTARDDDVDKIVGLEMGADDYLTKPFNPRELVARIKALLRRSSRSVEATAPIHIGDLTIDPGRHEVSVDGKQIALRTQEFALLVVLANHKGLVLSREQCLQLAWGYDYFGETRTVDVHIAQLRKKLEGSSVTIDTVTGIGYKLVA